MDTIYYKLQIHSSNSLMIKNIMGNGECLSDNIFEYKIIDDGITDNDIYPLDYYLDLLEVKNKNILNFDNLAKFTLWITHEYKEQCNMEFPSEYIQRMANLNIYLCISAYQYDIDQDKWKLEFIK